MRKTLLFCLPLLLLFGCDDHIKVYFQKAVTGRSADKLVGSYLITSESIDPDSGYVSVTIERSGKKEYLISTESKEFGKKPEADTLFQGEIVRRGQDYFINVPVEDHPGYWEIRGFRWGEDSVYNFVDAITGSQKDVFLKKDNFKSFYMEEKEKGEETKSDTLYFIQNRMRETIRAFRQLHEEEKEDVLHMTPIKEKTIDFLKYDHTAQPQLLYVYPNPASDHLYLKSLGEEALTIRVMSLAGELVQEIQMESPLKSLDLQNLSSGMYLLDIRNESGSLRQSLKVNKR